MYQTTFKRKEIKYLISNEQFEKLLPTFLLYMKEDNYFHSDISNLYYDTFDYRMVLNSLQKPQYKEKLRLRSYGNDECFCEIKKKVQGIVYKRRVLLPYEDALAFLNDNRITDDSQIVNELKWMLESYHCLTPKFYISYKRDAYIGIEDNVRMTFDSDILWRKDNLDLKDNNHGKKLLKDKEMLMEIKVSNAFPFWLARLLSDNQIYPVSFSKYGNAYIESRKEFNYA